MTFNQINNSSASGIKLISRSIYSWRIWLSLGLQDILLRYRGSVIGPFWITISTAITVFSMGILYGVLFVMNRSSYLPYFTSGLITWQFISMIISESIKIFTESKPYLENLDLPCLVYILRMVVRNVIIWLHNLPVYFLIALLYKIDFNLNLLLIIPGLFVLCLNAVLYSSLIALISARFPDIGSIILNVIQVLFFITPIMWMQETLPARFHIYLKLNPFFYFVNMLRNPLLGLPYNGEDLFGIFAITLTGLMLFVPVLKKYNTRVIFWL